MLLSINRNILDKGISMSSKTDQLIAKALSTTSEDEAIACLHMARKQMENFLCLFADFLCVLDIFYLI